MRCLPAFISAALLLPITLRAEGSCTWSDISPLLSQAPQIEEHIKASLDIEESGIANRMGSQFAGLSGARVGPYRFRVKHKGETGPYQFDLVLHTDLVLFDSQGNRLEPEDATNASTYREIFDRITLEKIKVEPSIVRQSEPDTPKTAEAMAKDDDRIAKIRERFNEINLGDHEIYAIPFVNENLPMEAKVVYHRNANSGEIDYITVDGSMGDHSGFSESFYFDNGDLIFVFQQDSHWAFHPQDPKQTIDTMVEKRYYFENGAVFDANLKEYEGGGMEKLQEAARNAEKEPLAVDGQEAIKIVARASRLLLARNAEDVSKIYEVAFSGS